MAEQKGMYGKKTVSRFPKEVTRELKGRTSTFKGHTKSDSMTKELNGGNPFSKGTSKRLKHETKDSMLRRPVAGLPKNDDSMNGMLNNDQRSDRNVPEKMPKINIHQGRNDEHRKYDDDLGSGISNKAKRE